MEEKKEAVRQKSKKHGATEVINAAFALIAILILLIAWLIPTDAEANKPVLSLFAAFDTLSGIIVCALGFTGALIAGFGRRYSARFVGHAFTLFVFCIGVYVDSTINGASTYIRVPGASALIALGVIEIIWLICTVFFCFKSEEIDAHIQTMVARQKSQGQAESSADKLEKLHELHEKGLLTDEEYEAKRRDIIDEI